jgi:Uma2 family endonuclease
MAIQNPKRLISIDDYHRMAAEGLFSEDNRVELIDGEIVEMTAIGNPHASGVRRVADLLSTALGRQVLVDTQNPLLLGEWSEPQPDLTVLPRRADYYLSSAPTAQDAILVVEIADSSVSYDRKVKGPLYARHEIREYWLLDLPAKILEVYRRPGLDGYREVLRLRRGDTVSPEAFLDVVFAVSDLLGRD